MTTFSLCMIVKNEEKVLKRCLDSIADLMDEIIIVDTGSEDSTREIAAGYTDKIYDFKWINDFSAARNYAFSKATMEYIYCADADEMLDENNRRRLMILKEAMLPEIEIVQMHYLTGSEFNTTQNYMDELRPKLFRRLRTFTWINPVHETVRLYPVVFDSDVEILHLPESLHNKRDFSIFLSSFEKEGCLSSDQFSMYAKELFISGDDEDFTDALPAAQAILDSGPDDSVQEAACIMAHAFRISGRTDEFVEFAGEVWDKLPCSEICYELGEYYKSAEKKEQALIWYRRAIKDTEPVIDIRRGGQLAEEAMADMKNGL